MKCHSPQAYAPCSSPQFALSDKRFGMSLKLSRKGLHDLVGIMVVSRKGAKRFRVGKREASSRPVLLVIGFIACDWMTCRMFANLGGALPHSVAFPVSCLIPPSGDSGNTLASCCRCFSASFHKVSFLETFYCHEGHPTNASPCP